MADFLAGPITDPLPQRLTPASTTLIDGATINLDASVADVFFVTLGGDRTLAAPTNSKGGQILTLVVKQDAIGGHSLTFASAYGNVADSDLLKGANQVSVFTFLCIPSGASFIYGCTSTSTAASGLFNPGPMTIAATSSSQTLAVDASLNGKPVIVSVANVTGVIAAMVSVVFQGSVAGGVLTVECIDAATGNPQAVTADVVLNVFVDPR